MRKLIAILIPTLLAACGTRDDSIGAAPAAELERHAAQQTAGAEPAKVAAPPAAPVMPAPESLSDGAITGRIQNALVGDPAMTGADISVNTDKGVVVLYGIVQSHEQAGIASAHAQRQDGVMRVDNHLRPAFS